MPSKKNTPTVITITKIENPEIEAEVEALFGGQDAVDAAADQAEVEALAALLAAAQDADATAPATTTDTPDPVPSFLDAYQAQEIVARQIVAADVDNEFETRATYERAVNPNNANIQDTLKKERARMAQPGLAGVLLAVDVSPEFINRELITGKRYNVYALGKLNDLMYALVSGHMKNAVNIAVMRSLFACRKAGYAFTGVVAQAAVSDKVKIDKAIGAVLTRHTVSAATAPTQTSSTMSALETLGVVANRGSQKLRSCECSPTLIGSL